MVEAQSPRELPPEIIFYNILPRLPGKSLPRFMLVSKEWHYFINTPSFEKLHIHQATNDHHQNNLKLLIFSTETRHMFTAIDREAIDQDGLTVSLRFPFKTKDGSGNMTILASFGGLVCVGITEHKYESQSYSCMILSNPLTGDYKTLSKPNEINSHKDCYKRYHQRAFGLYYSSCDDNYKLVCVTRDLNAYIYSLKSDSWRRADSTGDLKRIAAYLFPHCLWPSVALNEKLYFLKHGSMISFDTKTEKFTEIATPCFLLKNQYNVYLSLKVLRGCIYFFVIYRTGSGAEGHVECWRMDEDGNLIKEVTLPKGSYIVEPLQVVSKGYSIAGCSADGRVWKLDLTRHVIKYISWSFPHDCYIPHGGKYIETLVSPNRR